MAHVDDPLALSAPLAWELAPRLCRIDPATGESCAWSHGLWPYLRLLGLIGEIGRRADFFERALARVTGAAGPPRIMISGAADYSMLAHVLATFRGRGVEPEITVVDLCETPLALNRWYAERASCRIATSRCDVLEYAPATAFDAVCTDAFLGRFSPQERPALFARWHALVRRGGLAITTCRLRPAGTPAPVRFTADQARSFTAEVLRLAGEARDCLAVDPQALARSAAVYAERHFTYPVCSAGEVGELLGNAGFAPDELSVITLANSGRPGVSGPSMRGNNEFLTCVARRL